MAEETGKKRNWNWTRTLLVLSLGLNLAVAGVVIGSAIGHRHGDRSDRFYNGGMRAYVSALPDSQRQTVRQRLARDRDAFRATRQALRDSERAIRDAIVAEPFNAEALNAAFAGQRAIYDGLAGRGHMALVEILDGMTDAERAKFVENLRSFRRPEAPAGN